MQSEQKKEASDKVQILWLLILLRTSINQMIIYNYRWFLMDFI